MKKVQEHLLIPRRLTSSQSLKRGKKREVLIHGTSIRVTWHSDGPDEVTQNCKGNSISDEPLPQRYIQWATMAIQRSQRQDPIDDQIDKEMEIKQI